MIVIWLSILDYQAWIDAEFAFNWLQTINYWKLYHLGTCEADAGHFARPTYLRTLDPEMFQKLTTERRYVFWYNKNRYSRCREFFTITDNFLLWGNEGVVTCFVQSVMDSPLEKTSPFKKRNGASNNAPSDSATGFRVVKEALLFSRIN